jgi:uncharacterized protein
MSPAAPVCLITGASAGIGVALAWQFARNGHALVLTARRGARIESLAGDIAGAGFARPVTIAADLATAAGIDALAAALAERGLEPAIVVNNAGFGLFGPAAGLDRERQLTMIDVNARALTDLSLRWLKGIKRHRGGILNVASVAGFLPGPGMAVYHATKAYVLSFTQALHAELSAHGVRVCALCPGPVATEFFAVAGIPDGYYPALFAHTAERVARKGYDGFMAGRRVVIPGEPNRMVPWLARLLPRAFLLAMTAQRWRRAAFSGR